MSTYIFVCRTEGRNYVDLTIQNPPLKFQFEFEEMQMGASLFLYGGGTFNVEVTCDHLVRDIGALCDVVLHTMCGLYDSVGLSTGRTLPVILEGFFLVGSGQFAKISFSLPEFSQLISQAGLSLNDWIGLSISNPHLRAALRDIRLAMHHPGEVAVHCFRAIERIRQTFSTANDRKRSWESLASALNVSRSWLDTYTAHATAVRHGELIELSLSERDKCLAQAATVVIRYAAFLKGDRINLATPAFPNLA